MAKLLLSVMGAVAEFEREIIRERQREGIAIARAAGKFSKERTKKLSSEQVATIARREAGGEKIAALAREYGISRQTLYTYLKQA